MDKYYRVPKSYDNDTEPNEVRIGGIHSQVSRSIEYGLNLLKKEENPFDSIIVKAIGSKMISKAIFTAEIIKLRVSPLHQITEIGTTDTVTQYMPKEEGLDKVEIKKKSAFIKITLSKSPLDTTNPGYQAPSETPKEKQIRPIGSFRGRRGGFRGSRGGFRGSRGGSISRGGGSFRGSRRGSRRGSSRGGVRRGGFRGGSRRGISRRGGFRGGKDTTENPDAPVEENTTETNTYTTADTESYRGRGGRRGGRGRGGFRGYRGGRDGYRGGRGGRGDRGGRDRSSGENNSPSNSSPATTTTSTTSPTPTN
ncbi:hypothetical protein DICPUDRAFT_92680 [Dictyostelium purpureum]|uniref:DNA/RNA-binding protein Alba-like domain-containing protein n=1 Tax=Dictyostelium purpureum TaxID=5786 RepID=F0ZVN6_DICPU|nr:uncharacterized protein DICPUDRAFT_92680 [Dictyostelium purpureum]EGC31990.1 hypothetical protein DICPUDRAFT_92680 [Dictyostelium purpureum]|eukprot:XP_003291488.1 hypothetical protein DICPUDRAFT_92680 [Dictyostelium purpureum]